MFNFISTNVIISTVVNINCSKYVLFTSRNRNILKLIFMQRKIHKFDIIYLYKIYTLLQLYKRMIIYFEII